MQLFRIVFMKGVKDRKKIRKKPEKSAERKSTRNKKMIFFLKGTKKFLKAHLKEVETKTTRRLSKKRERTYNEEFS